MIPAGGMTTQDLICPATEYVSAPNVRNMEAAVRFLDCFYDPAVSVQGLFGGISDGCSWSRPATTASRFLTRLIPTRIPVPGNGQAPWLDNAPMYIRRSTEIEMARDMTFALEERKYTMM